MMTSAKERSPASRHGVTKVRHGFSIPPNGKDGGMKSKSYLPRNSSQGRPFLSRAGLTSPSSSDPELQPLNRQALLKMKPGPLRASPASTPAFMLTSKRQLSPVLLSSQTGCEHALSSTTLPTQCLEWSQGKCISYVCIAVTKCVRKITRRKTCFGSWFQYQAPGLMRQSLSAVGVCGGGSSLLSRQETE